MRVVASACTALLASSRCRVRLASWPPFHALDLTRGHEGQTDEVVTASRGMSGVLSPRDSFQKHTVWEMVNYLVNIDSALGAPRRTGALAFIPAPVVVQSADPLLPPSFSIPFIVVHTLEKLLPLTLQTISWNLGDRSVSNL